MRAYRSPVGAVWLFRDKDGYWEGQIHQHSDGSLSNYRNWHFTKTSPDRFIATGWEDVTLNWIMGEFD